MSRVCKACGIGRPPRPSAKFCQRPECKRKRNAAILRRLRAIARKNGKCGTCRCRERSENLLQCSVCLGIAKECGRRYRAKKRRGLVWDVEECRWISLP